MKNFKDMQGNIVTYEDISSYGRPDHDGVAQSRGDGLGLFHAVGQLALGHLDAERIHGVFEGLAVLPARWMLLIADGTDS